MKTEGEKLNSQGWLRNPSREMVVRFLTLLNGQRVALTGQEAALVTQRDGAWFIGETHVDPAFVVYLSQGDRDHLYGFTLATPKQRFMARVKALKADPELGGKELVVSYTKLTVTVRTGYFYRPCAFDVWETKWARVIAAHGFQLIRSRDNWQPWPRDSFYEAVFYGGQL